MLELARLGIAGRPGTALDEAEAALERLGAADRAEVVRMPEIGGLVDRGSGGGSRRAARSATWCPTGSLRLIASGGLYREAVRA